MNNTTTTDSFEAIAKDAVELLLTIIADLGNSEHPADKAAALVIALSAEDFCNRAIALGAV